jgi:hypothetical protein
VGDSEASAATEAPPNGAPTKESLVELAQDAEETPQTVDVEEESAILPRSK